MLRNRLSSLSELASTRQMRPSWLLLVCHKKWYGFGRNFWNPRVRMTKVTVMIRCPSGKRGDSGLSRWGWSAAPSLTYANKILNCYIQTSKTARVKYCIVRCPKLFLSLYIGYQAGELLIRDLQGCQVLLGGIHSHYFRKQTFCKY